MLRLCGDYVRLPPFIETSNTLDAHVVGLCSTGSKYYLQGVKEGQTVSSLQGEVPFPPILPTLPPAAKHQ
jgi:hypothetical protein